jgi:hypothetical protein
MKRLLVSVCVAASASAAAAAGVPGKRLAAATPARTAPKAPPPGAGGVVYQTRERIFLNRGQTDGLTVGTVLHLTREGRVTGQCKVDSVSEHAATCSGKGPKPGDTFKLGAPVAGPVITQLPGVLTPSETSRRQSMVSAQPLQKVAFDQSRAQSPLHLGGPVMVALHHNFWTSFAAAPGEATTFQSERLDLSVQGADITHGLRLFLDATAMYWTQQPPNARLPYTSNTVLLVRQTEIERRQSGDTFVGSVGRILPAEAPGSPVVDGMQAGWRSSTGGLEVGAFGGFVPDPVSLAPSLNRWTAGAYAALTYVGEKRDLVRLFHESFRVAAVTAPEAGYGTRVEAETAAQAWMAMDTSLAGDVRFGVGSATAPGLLEAARFDVDSQPRQGFHVGGSFRYLNTPVGDVLTLGAPSFATNGTHFDVTFAWTDSRVIGVSGYGGAWTDANTGLTHGEIAPELDFPRLFGDGGGLGFGYQQEFGYWGQRTVFAQTLLQPIGRLRLMVRALYLQDTPASGTGDFNTDEVGATFDSEVGITSWLALHLGALVRHNLGPEAPTGVILRNVSSSGLSASAGLIGRL